MRTELLRKSQARGNNVDNDNLGQGEVRRREESSGPDGSKTEDGDGCSRRGFENVQNGTGSELRPA
jgi:hypothetical protein